MSIKNVSIPGNQVDFTISNFFKYAKLSFDLAVVCPIHDSPATDPIYNYIAALIGKRDREKINAIFNSTWEFAFRRLESTFAGRKLNPDDFSKFCNTEAIGWLKRVANLEYKKWLEKKCTFDRHICLDFDEPYGENKDETKGNNIYAEKISENSFVDDSDLIEFLISSKSPFSGAQKEALHAKMEIVEKNGLRRFYLKNSDTEAALELGISRQAFLDRKKSCIKKYNNMNFNKN